MKLKIADLPLLILFCFPVFLSCNKEDDASAGNCEETPVINNLIFSNTATGHYNIEDASITEDCLTITFSSSGCDGNQWVVELVDRGAIAESNPPQRELRLLLDNPEDCEAYLTSSVSFNLEPLRLNTHEVLLNLEGWEELLTYSY